MVRYFARRVLLMIPTLLGISVVIFTVMHLVPGGPVEQALMQMRMGTGEAGGRGGAQNIPESAIQEMKRAFGFDQPVHIRYVRWLWRVVHLDFGESYKTFEPVSDVIRARLPVSLYFGIIGFTLSYLVCVPLGVFKAVRHGSAFDVTSSTVVFVGYSLPGWAVGMILLVLLGGGTFWNVFPLGGIRATTWEDLPSPAQETEDRDEVTDDFGEFSWEKMSWRGQWLDRIYHTILPIFCYMIGGFATLTVLTKNSVLETLGQDYVRTALAKGLHPRRVLFVHVLRNSLIPIATGLGNFLSVFMAGSFLIEYAFNIRGIGLLGYESLMDRDYPVAMAILMINAFLSLVGNLFSDMMYAMIDPRIRFK